MTSNEHVDKQGNPLGLNEWAKLFEDIDYKRIARDEFDDFTVSTVWTGEARGPFETIVFGVEGEMRTYSTEAEAKAGHAEYVAWLKGEGPDPTSTFKDRATSATDEALRLIRDHIPGARVIVLIEGLDEDDNHIAVGNSRSGEEGEWSVEEMVDSLEFASRMLGSRAFGSRYSW